MKRPTRQQFAFLSPCNFRFARPSNLARSCFNLRASRSCLLSSLGANSPWKSSFRSTAASGTPATSSFRPHAAHTPSSLRLCSSRAEGPSAKASAGAAACAPIVPCVVLVVLLLARTHAANQRLVVHPRDSGSWRPRLCRASPAVCQYILKVSLRKLFRPRLSRSPTGQIAFALGVPARRQERNGRDRSCRVFEGRGGRLQGHPYTNPEFVLDRCLEASAMYKYALLVAPLNGLNGECEWTTVGRGKFYSHYITE